MRRSSASITRLFTRFRPVVLAIRLAHSADEGDFAEAADAALEEVVELALERRRRKGGDKPGE